MRHRPQHGAGCSSTPCAGLSRNGGNKSLFHYLQPFSLPGPAAELTAGCGNLAAGRCQALSRFPWVLPAWQTHSDGQTNPFSRSPFLSPSHTDVCRFPAPALLPAAGSISHRAGVLGSSTALFGSKDQVVTPRRSRLREAPAWAQERGIARSFGDQSKKEQPQLLAALWVQALNAATE